MPHLDVGIDSSLDAVPAVGEAVRQLCLASAVGEADASLVELAVVEAIHNSIEHGYGGQAGGRIDISVEIDDGQILVDIHDAGSAVDLERIAAPRPPADQESPLDRASLAERGRGLDIIRGVFDHVAFSRSASGNWLALRRQRREVP